MSKQANPTVIGGFVLGAIALLVAAILLFGGTQLFTERATYIVYFPGSVKGLRVGASVNFRGVSIGQVTDIRVLYHSADQSMQIPVVLEIQPDRITVIGEEEVVEQQDDLDRLIQLGMRAQLQMESMVTGLLFINVDFHPDTEVVLMDETGLHPEMPAIPSSMEQIEQTVGDVLRDAPQLIADLTELLSGISDSFSRNRGNFDNIFADLAAMTDRLENAGPAIDRLVDDSAETFAAIRNSASNVDAILKANKEPLSAAITNLQETAASVQRMADQVNNMMAENRDGLRDFTTTGLYEITGLAQDAQRMVDQITRVTEELERDPSRFLFGDRTEGVSAE